MSRSCRRTAARLRIYGRQPRMRPSRSRRRRESLRPRSAAPGSTRSRPTRAFGDAGQGDQAQAARVPDRGPARRASSVAGYGAPGKGNTLLNYCGIRTDFLDYTVDRNPYKQGQFLPGTHIPIFAPEKIRETRPDYVLILPWNLKEEITKQLAYIREWGGKFVIPIPELQIHDPADLHLKTKRRNLARRNGHGDGSSHDSEQTAAWETLPTGAKS